MCYFRRTKKAVGVHSLFFVNDLPASVIYSLDNYTLGSLTLVPRKWDQSKFELYKIWPLTVIRDTQYVALVFSSSCLPTSSRRFIRSWPRPRWRRRISSQQLLLQYILNVTWNEHVACFMSTVHFISYSHHTTHLNGLSAKHVDLWTNKLNYPECCPALTHKICVYLCPRPEIWSEEQSMKKERGI